jgi:hypothetical protein
VNEILKIRIRRRRRRKGEKRIAMSHFSKSWEKREKFFHMCLHMNTEVTFGVLDITEDSMTQGFRLEANKKCELLVVLCHKFHGKSKTKYNRKSSLCL